MYGEGATEQTNAGASTESLESEITRARRSESVTDDYDATHVSVLATTRGGWSG